jgi:hypothetical protein
MHHVAGLDVFFACRLYAGMPDFLSHNASAKHLYFGSARFVAAVPLLLVTLRSWQRLMTVFTKYLIFSALLLLTAIVKWVVIYYRDWLPHLSFRHRDHGQLALAALARGTHVQ